MTSALPARRERPAGADDLSIPRTLVMTGHFPPEPGGVQTLTYELVRRLPPDRLVVVAPHHPQGRAFDATLGFPVYRRRGYALPWRLRSVVRTHGVEAAWVTAAAPFGLYAPALRWAGIGHIVASTHGQELGWVRVPPTRWALRGVVRTVDVLTYLTEATRDGLASVLGPGDEVAQLSGGIDTETFHPGAGGDAVRLRLGLGSRPMVLAVSRLVRRKGHDMLLRAWPEVRRRVPDAALVIVGEGPLRRRLERQAAEPPLRGSVYVTGTIEAAEVPAFLDAADVFVAPCRDTRAGLQVEGLGLSVLEASATGVPVVVGRSGGSPYALLDGRTGLLVDARAPGPLAAALGELLIDPELARSMGEQGRRWVSSRWTWQAAVSQLARLLRGEPGVTPAGGEMTGGGMAGGETVGLTGYQAGTGAAAAPDGDGAG